MLTVRSRAKPPRCRWDTELTTFLGFVYGCYVYYDEHTPAAVVRLFQIRASDRRVPAFPENRVGNKIKRSAVERLKSDKTIIRCVRANVCQLEAAQAYYNNNCSTYVRLYIYISVGVRRIYCTPTHNNRRDIVTTKRSSPPFVWPFQIYTGMYGIPLSHNVTVLYIYIYICTRWGTSYRVPVKRAQYICLKILLLIIIYKTLTTLELSHGGG